MDPILLIASVPILVFLATWLSFRTYVEKNVPSEILPPVFRRVTKKTLGFILAPFATVIGASFLILQLRDGGSANNVFIALYGTLILLQLALTAKVVMGLNTEILDALGELEDQEAVAEEDSLIRA